MTFSEIWYYLLIVALGAYFIGDINFALVISRAKKRDVRNIGSGNPGTLNMTRNFGLGFAIHDVRISSCVFIGIEVQHANPFSPL